MVRKSGWLSKVKKALKHESKEDKAERIKSRKKRLGKEHVSITEASDPVTEVPHVTSATTVDESNPINVEDEQANHAYSVAVATAAAAEAVAAAAQAAAVASELVRYTRFTGMSREEAAAIQIQTTYRSYMARKTLKSVRGLVRLKSLVDGPMVKRHTSHTLKCMQALSRVHGRVQSRRFQFLEEGRSLQREILQKRAKELESMKIGEEWDDSMQSKEQIEENLLQKYDAAMRREKALAYSYTHQRTWKKSSKPTNLLFMNPTNPQWGWSWLERWMASLPNETMKITSVKDPNSDQLSTTTSNIEEITKSFAHHTVNSENISSPNIQKSPSTHSRMATRKLKSSSLRNQDDESKSAFSIQSDQTRRHTIAGSPSQDDERLSNSPVPSYMAPTHSAKAKLKLPTPLGMRNGRSTEKLTAKKRFSFPQSPSRFQRLSASRKVEDDATGR